MSGYLIEDDVLALVPYTIDDAPDWLACWQDEVTQRGFNYVMPNDLHCVLTQEITRFPFWVVALEKQSGARLGVLRLSPDPVHPDLAIWMYPQSRGRGYGTRAFAPWRWPTCLHTGMTRSMRVASRTIPIALRSCERTALPDGRRAIRRKRALLTARKSPCWDSDAEEHNKTRSLICRSARFSDTKRGCSFEHPL